MLSVDRNTQLNRTITITACIIISEVLILDLRRRLELNVNKSSGTAAPFTRCWKELLNFYTLLKLLVLLLDRCELGAHDRLD